MVCHSDGHTFRFTYLFRLYQNCQLPTKPIHSYQANQKASVCLINSQEKSSLITFNRTSSHQKLHYLIEQARTIICRQSIFPIHEYTQALEMREYHSIESTRISCSRISPLLWHRLQLKFSLDSFLRMIVVVLLYISNLYYLQRVWAVIPFSVVNLTDLLSYLQWTGVHHCKSTSASWTINQHSSSYQYIISQLRNMLVS